MNEDEKFKKAIKSAALVKNAKNGLDAAVIASIKGGAENLKEALKVAEAAGHESTANIIRKAMEEK